MGVSFFFLTAALKRNSLFKVTAHCQRNAYMILFYVQIIITGGNLADSKTALELAKTEGKNDGSKTESSMFYSASYQSLCHSVVASYQVYVFLWLHPIKVYVSLWLHPIKVHVIL